MATPGPDPIHRIAPGGAHWFALGAGDEFDVISPFGPQVADSWAFNAHDPSEYLSVEHCRLEWSRVRPRAGDMLVSNRRNAMLELVEDRSGGMHDTLLPACDTARYARLGHRGPHRNCAQNLADALQTVGLPAATPAPLNLFEHTRLDADGGITILPPTCPPGGSVRLRAAMRLLMIVSACPQDMAPTNGTDRRIKPIDIAVHGAADVAKGGCG